MAQSGFTPISLYFSATSAAVPSAGNLVAGELALNTNDGKLYYKNSSGVVTLLAGATSGPAGGSTTQVQYNNAGVLAGITGATTNGTALTLVAPVLGTPASGTVTNLTGTASININGTVGATTPAAGAFTSLTASTTLGVTGVSTLTAGAIVQGLTVGLGAGAVATNTAVGASAISVNSVGVQITSIGYQSLLANTGSYNTAVGYQSGLSNVSGTLNTFIGRVSGNFTTGSSNTMVGDGAGYFITSGASNTFLGANAGPNAASFSTGSYNVGLGAQTLYNNTTASNNTAVGYQALYSNTTTDAVVAIGWHAGYSKTTGGSNFAQTYVGTKAGYSNATGIDNTYIGGYAGYTSTGSYNTVLGAGALYLNTTASNNTAVGYQAGYSNTTSSYNTLIGYQAGYSLNTTGNALNTFVGQSAGYNVTTGTKNTIIGTYNGNQGSLDIRTASNYIVLSDGDGNPRGVFDSSGNLGIGNASPNSRMSVAVSSTSTSVLGSYANIPLLLQNTSSTDNNWSVIGVQDASGDFSSYIGTQNTSQASNTAIMAFATNGGSGATERMRIGATGIVTMSAYGAGTATFSAAGVISSVSDETWKIKDGAPVDTDAMLQKLAPGYWYYNDEKKETFGKDRQLGFYAQNVNAAIGKEAAPEPETVVTKNDDGTETSVTKPWGYYDRSVLAVTVMSLQKALATIESLTVRITALEAK